jgi:serine/threonine protein kinase
MEGREVHRRRGQASVLEVKKVSEPNGESYALKVLRTEEGTQAYERFHREVNSLQTLSHPAIVKVIDHKSDVQEGLHFYVMEYVRGAVPLKKLVGTNRNPFHRSATESLKVYIQILEALTVCEKAQVVHRDLSLGNVLYDPESGSIKLIDFGCCHLEDGHCITLTDEAVGTPHYRAPECDGYSESPPTIAADLYSAGKILWSLLTNRKAFDREKPVFNALSLSKVLPNDQPTWHLHDVFAGTIRRNPQDRYASAAEALADAQRILGLLGANIPPLEVFAGELCPVCRAGKLVKPNRMWNSRLVAPNELASDPNQDRSAISRELSTLDLGQGIYNYDLCLTCGFISTRVRSIPQHLLQLRNGLE